MGATTFLEQADKKIEQYWNTDMIDVDCANEVVNMLGTATNLIKQLEPPLKSYTPSDDERRYTVRIRFQSEDSRAEIQTTIVGTMSGGEVIQTYTDLSTGLTAPSDNPVNQRFCIFEELSSNVYKEVEGITLYNLAGETQEYELEDATELITSIEIINVEDVEYPESGDME